MVYGVWLWCYTLYYPSAYAKCLPIPVVVAVVAVVDQKRTIVRPIRYVHFTEGIDMAYDCPF